MAEPASDCIEGKEIHLYSVRAPMINENASNWIDRGEASEPKIAKTLRHFLGFEVELEDTWLLDRASILVGMVAADASEIQLASYLGSLEREVGVEPVTGKQRRVTAIAIWHIAKSAETRDRALRLLQDEPVDAQAEHRRLSEWLSEQIERGRR